MNESRGKLEQILVIEPTEELVFKGPFTSSVTSYLQVANPSNKTVCFKLKTTMPKKYNVTPNMGLLEPKNFITICSMPLPTVTLHAGEFNENEKHKHRFIVQSMVLTSKVEDDLTWDLLWASASPDQLMNSKFKCVFETPSLEEEMKTAENTPSENPAISNSSSREMDLAREQIAILEENLSRSQRENMELREEKLKLNENLHQSNLPTNTSQLEVYTPEKKPIQINRPAILYVTCGIVVGSLSVLLKKYLFST